MEKQVNYDASLDAELEQRSKINYIRDDSNDITVGDITTGKITSYAFHISIKDKSPLVGRLTREQMDLIYRLYSSEGSNLTQRVVSRYFPEYTFQDFKRILRAFSITKASSPLAPHIIEEKTTEELIQLTLQSKENDYLKKLEQDRNRLTELRLKELTKEHYTLKQRVADFSEFLSTTDFNVEPVEFIPEIQVSNKTLLLYLSDLHIGADVSDYSIYNNKFNFEVATKRMDIILQHIFTVCKNQDISKITVCNIGDSVDGLDAQTTRRGHVLPQNMNNKDQYKNYIKLMLQLFRGLSDFELFNKIGFVSVEGGNHDGDFGYVINKALEALLSVYMPHIQTTIFDKFIDYIEVEKHIFIMSHGKDAKDMFKSFPLTLDIKSENKINEWLDYNKIYHKNIHFIKGDLHQSATTYGKRFRYKSVSSFFGSSEWIHKNFGNTIAAVDYDIIDNDNVYESRILLQ